MSAGLVWIFIGLCLFGAELLLPGVFLLWIGLAAIGSGLVLLAWPGLAFGWVVATFIGLLSAGILVGLWLRRFAGDRPGVNLPGSAVVGRIGIVTDTTGPLLRVRLGDSDWAAESEERCVVGDRVAVSDVAGTHLKVRRAGPSASVMPPGA